MEIVASRVSVYEIEIHTREWGKIQSNAIPGFADALVSILPDLEQHQCMSGQNGGFLQEVRKGTNLAHVIEHVLIAMLNRTYPGEVSYTGWTRQTGPGRYTIHYSAPDFLTGRVVALLATDLVRHMVAGLPVTLEGYLDRLRRPTDSFTRDDPLLTAALCLHSRDAGGHQKTAAGNGDRGNLTSEQVHGMAEIFRQLQSDLGRVTEQWRAALIEYAGDFGRSIRAKLALVNPDQFLERLLAEDYAGYTRALQRASGLLLLSRIPTHFIVHSLWLYKTALINVLIDKAGSQRKLPRQVLQTCEAFFEAVLRVASAEAPAMLAVEGERPAGPEVAEFREVGDNAGRILIVDDDDMMLRVSRDMLEYNGYRTATARDGTEALRIATDSSHPIAGLILDVQLREGGMDSRELYHEVIAVRPELQTLVVTGFPVTPELREAFPESKVLWLQKPFSRLELLARVELLWGAACRAT